MKRFLLFAFLGLPLLLSAQSFYNLRLPRNVSVYTGGITTQYVGELNPSPGQGMRGGVTIGTEFFFHHRFSVRGEFNAFRLYGSDRLFGSKDADEQGNRNLSFFSNNKELSFLGTVNLLPLPNRFDKRPYINLYAFTGFGLMTMNPKTRTDAGKVEALQPLRTEGVRYSRVQPVLPAGLGLKIKFGMVYSLIFEAGYRFTNTDYIDDVSGIPRPDNATKGGYPDPATLGSDLARELSDRRILKLGNVRGNPSTTDGYWLFNVKVEYYLKEVFDPFDVGRNKLLYFKKGRR